MRSAVVMQKIQAGSKTLNVPVMILQKSPMQLSPHLCMTTDAEQLSCAHPQSQQQVPVLRSQSRRHCVQIWREAA